MFRPGDDYLGELLLDGPPAARCELVRSLTSDDFGPRVLAQLRDDGRPVIVRGIAIADAAWARAVRRVQALAAVHEDHVAPLLAYGRHQGLAYFVHEHDDGPRLNAVLHERGGRLPLDTALLVFGQLLLAVGQAHRRGVVVGGVRPQDVRVLSGDPVRIRVRNLGLATVLGVPAGRRGATDHPSIYRAPEADVSALPASDVFSLGVLLVRMLTGPLPCTATEAERGELLRARVEQALRDDPGFTDGLATLLLEVVDADLATRPRDAQHLLEALLEVVPACALRLPVAPPAEEPSVTEDGAPCWPARPWTMLQGRRREPRLTPIPGYAPAARPTERPAASPWLAHAHAHAQVEAKAAGPAAAPVVPGGRRAAWRRSMVGRVALGAGSLAGMALALALAVGEPGATPPPSADAIAAPGPLPDPAPRTVDAPVAAASTLVVDATPPGMLTIDGQRVGTTPHHGPLAPGRHVVRVEAPGHQAWRARIEVAPGEARHLEITLERALADSKLALSSVAAR